MDESSAEDSSTGEGSAVGTLRSGGDHGGGDGPDVAGIRAAAAAEHRGVGKRVPQQGISRRELSRDALARTAPRGCVQSPAAASAGAMWSGCAQLMP